MSSNEQAHEEESRNPKRERVKGRHQSRTLPKVSHFSSRLFSTWLILSTFLFFTVGAQQQDPMTLNGGSVLAMAGDECVALAVDKRFGSGPQMVAITPRHVLAPTPQLMVAFTGLEGDVQSLSQELTSQVSSKLGRGLGFMNENRQQRNVISPRAMASLTSHVLYNRKRANYFVEPLVVGLSELPLEDEVISENTHVDGGTDQNDSNNKLAVRKNEDSTRLISNRIKYQPYLCSLDVIGAKSVSDAFVCAGAASNSIFGTAESMWRPGLNKEELANVCAKAFLSALERDCLSGYGAVLYLITRDGIEQYDLANRND